MMQSQEYFQINKEISNRLKGLAILLVLIGHGLAWLTNCNQPILLNSGCGGVAIFLMLSGYGLYKSYLLKPITTNWWTRRIKKVMLPFWFAMAVQTIIMVKLAHIYSFKDWLISFLGYVNYQTRETIDPTMWYITFLLICYFCFFFVFLLKIPDVYKVLIITVVFWGGVHTRLVYHSRHDDELFFILYRHNLGIS